HVYDDVVEARIDAVLGVRAPAEVEDADRRPAVAIDDAALERRHHLAGRRLHERDAERLEERRVIGRRAKAHAFQRAAWRHLGGPDMEADAVTVRGEEMRIDLLI